MEVAKRIENDPEHLELLKKSDEFFSKSLGMQTETIGFLLKTDEGLYVDSLLPHELLGQLFTLFAMEMDQKDSNTNPILGGFA